MQSDDEKFSEESKKFLLEAKKGKTRKFVMSKDGVQIDRLIIFKIGTFDHVIRKAKQDGAWGDMFFGMLNGDGTDIHFELSRADGFTIPPSTEVKLKEFLRDTAGLKLEPKYVIVDNLENADDDASVDERTKDESDDGGSTDSGAAKSGTAAGGPSVVDAIAEDKFIRILKSIVPHVKRALATKTSLSDQLQKSVREAQELGRQRDFERGMVALKKVGELTKQSLAEAGSAPATKESDSATPTSSAKDKRRQEWNVRLAEVQPRFKAAVKGAGPNVDKLKKVMWYSRNEARQQKFVKALVGLDYLERFLTKPE